MDVMLFIEGTKLSDDGILQGVHILGLKSKHRVKGKKEGYAYTEDAMKEAVKNKVYEGVDVFLGHPETDEKGNPKERNPKDKIGVTSNVTFKEGVGLIGNIGCNTGHPYYESMKWWSHNQPKKISLSHVAHTKYNDKQNSVVSIDKVDSVDIVNQGATTSGLFKEGVIADRVEEVEVRRCLDDLIDAFNYLIYQIKYPLGSMSLTDAEKAVKMTSIAQDLVRELKTFSTSQTKESIMEWNDVTLDELKKNKPEIFNAIESAGVAKANELNTKLEAKLADIPTDKRPAVFVKLVRESLAKNDEATADALIEDRKESLKAIPSTVTAHGRKPQNEVTTTVVKKKTLESASEDDKAPILSGDALLAKIN